MRFTVTDEEGYGEIYPLFCSFRLCVRQKSLQRLENGDFDVPGAAGGKGSSGSRGGRTAVSSTTAVDPPSVVLKSSMTSRERRKSKSNGGPGGK